MSCRTHVIHLQALGREDELPETKNRLHRALRKTCAEAGILPDSYYLDATQIKRLNEVPFASGGYSDVWRGSYKGDSVSIKAFRVYTTDNIKHLTKVSNIFHDDRVDDYLLTAFNLRQAWCKEIVVCRNVSHPNILSFLGVSATDSHPLCIVSKWMPNGNISEFLKTDGQINRRPLVRPDDNFFMEISHITSAPSLSSWTSSAA